MQISVSLATVAMAVPGLPVWTENGRGQEGMHVYLVTIRCDVICNSQSEPAEAELVCFEENTVLQWRKIIYKYEIYSVILLILSW